MRLFMIFLAILPAAVLMWYIYSKDKIEKEPAGLLVKIFLFGVLTTISAIILENVGEAVISFFVYEDTILYTAIDMFLVVALAEEAGKYFVVKKVAWKHPAFNYTFDAVVYAVFASLGFAALENILYVIDDSISTAVMRALLSVPGHAIDAVFMGNYFGMAKRCEALGDESGKKYNLKMALIVPVLTHGFYDFCLSIDVPGAMVVFFIFEVVITIVAFNKVNKLSREDTSIFPDGFYPGANRAQQLYYQGLVNGYQPVQGFIPIAQSQPVQGFNPVAQPQPVQGYQSTQPRFAMNFDPMTGEPIAKPQYAMNFDPMTGEPIAKPKPAMNFDPVTGEPLNR